MSWELAVANQELGEIVQRALDDGPRAITRDGETVVVVLSAEVYRRLTGDRQDFREFFLSSPDLGALDLKRPADEPREIEV